MASAEPYSHSGAPARRPMPKPRPPTAAMTAVKTTIVSLAWLAGGMASLMTRRPCPSASPPGAGVPEGP
jgi:hypothetical protein